MIRRKANVYKLDTPSTTLLIRAEGTAEFLYYGERLSVPGSDYGCLFSEGVPLFSCGPESFLSCSQAGTALFSGFVFQRARLTEKPVISPLPSSFSLSGKNAGQTLCLEFAEESAKLRLFFFCTVFDDCEGVVFSSRLVNGGRKEVSVRRLDSLALGLPGGLNAASSRAGEPTVLTGKQGAYAITLLGTGEGMNRTQSSGTYTRVFFGDGDFLPDRILAPGESLFSSEAVSVFAPDRGEALRALRGFFSRHVVRGKWREKERPVAVEYDGRGKTPEEIFAAAESWAKAGAELFLLECPSGNCPEPEEEDAGQAREAGALAEGIRSRGMKFGLTLCPERVETQDSVLKKHPEFALRIPGKTGPEILLDLADPRVRKYIVRTVSAAVSGTKAACVRWKFGARSLLEAGRSGYAEGLCAVLEKLTEKFPGVLFEGDFGEESPCPGLLSRFQRFRAPARLFRAAGACPQSAVSFRLSAEEAGGRVAISAFFGTPGFRADGPLSPDGAEAVGKFLSFYKKYRRAAEYGEWYDLGDAGGVPGICAVAENKGCALAAVFPGKEGGRMFWKGLEPASVYVVRFRSEKGAAEYTVSGELLMKGGIPLPEIFSGQARNGQAVGAGPVSDESGRTAMLVTADKSVRGRSA